MGQLSFNENDDLLNKRFILNPNYVMRSDVNRVILTSSGSQDFDKILQPNVGTFIHPIHAMMFTFFKGDKTLEYSLMDMAHFFDLSIDKAYGLISKFIKNEKRVVVEYDNNFFYFPPNIIVEYDNNFSFRTYTVHDFNIKGTLDFDTVRYNIPIEASILLNNRCVTDCVYCYADKRKIYDCKIPFSRLVEIIDETKILGFRNVDIQGGELFLYKQWRELLEELFKAKYSVYISTKYPLSANQIKDLKELGLREIQISLDSIFIDDLKINTMVNDNYILNIINTIRLLNDNDFKIKLKPVITSFTFNIKRMEQYIDYFKQFKNIRIIEFTAPAHSMYKTQEQFLLYRLTVENINKIKDLVLRKSNECHFEVRADASIDEQLTQKPFEVRKSDFAKRSRCTGNQSSFLILPNGDVTFCEKAYFNSNLILGNILENSIMDVWNSKRAKDLFYISQSIFPKTSPCSLCAEFSDCRYKLGVCWVDIMAAYGEENWLYPAPNCPYAPPSKYITHYE